MTEYKQYTIKLDLIVPSGIGPEKLSMSSSLLGSILRAKLDEIGIGIAAHVIEEIDADPAEWSVALNALNTSLAKGRPDAVRPPAQGDGPDQPVASPPTLGSIPEGEVIDRERQQRRTDG